MPAVSRKQRQMMAIAEHHPEKLFKRNAGVIKMGKEKMHEFAKTPEKKLPESKKPRQLSTREYIGRRNRALYGK